MNERMNTISRCPFSAPPSRLQNPTTGTARETPESRVRVVRGPNVTIVAIIDHNPADLIGAALINDDHITAHESDDALARRTEIRNVSFAPEKKTM